MTRASDLAKLLGAGATINDGTTITTADNTDQLTLISTDADANVGPNLNLFRNSGSPADDDVLGLIIYNGRNDNSQDVIYARQVSYIKDASDGTEDGQLTLQTMVAGTIRDRLNINPTEIALNEDSQDLDFRVESNGNANMLFVDGGNNTVHIGQSVPDTTLSGGTPPFQITGSGFGATSAIVRREASSFGPSLMLAKSRNTAVGSHTIVQSGDRLGGIIFIGDDGTDLDTYGATITADCDGTPGANDMPGRLVFSTTADGANSPTERMRIHNGGVVSIPQGIALGVGTANTASNVIDDYEEGTFTPSLSTGSTTYAGNTDVGLYTKIGDICHVIIRYQYSGTINSGINARMSLPFTALSGSFQACCFRGNLENVDTAMAGIGGVAGANSTILYLQELTLQTTTPTLQGDDLGENFQIQISGFYKTT
jgi:hypothetical protein